jgi:uncharacterized protein YeaO (DUF488 family)
MLKSKSVYDPIGRSDGVRILAARFRGRGMKADRYDLWMPSLGPSESLLKEMLGGTLQWKDFAKRYRDELLLSESIDERNASVRNHGQKFTLRLIRELSRRQNVTLMCHCAGEERHCHLRVLERMIVKV